MSERDLATVPVFGRCDGCNGTGRRRLTVIERNTLASVDDTWTSTSDVVANLGGKVKHTAVIQRLYRLKSLGLLEVNKEQRPLEWRVAP